MSDKHDSGEGAQPPNERKLHSARTGRSRKLTGPAKLFAQDLVYAIWRTAKDHGNSPSFYGQLEKELLIITARWL